MNQQNIIEEVSPSFSEMCSPPRERETETETRTERETETETERYRETQR